MVLTSGCVSHKNFTSIPLTANDFNAPYAELAETYPEIPQYEKKGLRNNIPYAKHLVAAWGEPDAIKTHWWDYPYDIGFTVVLGSILDLSTGAIATVAGAVYVLVPGPRKTYVWVKGNHCVEAETHVVMTSLYRRTFFRWKWSDIHEEKSLSKECKKVVARKQRNGVVSLK